ncbi:PilZ domain-containing protein [Aestuariibius sp. HNIBRBA575]|uniref:PilZ domain-containing protein n=1 Tax=Aestuariibius sp. HNIBRBA575 TaxID=3233343 RepID=UPI0034A4B30D
MAHSIVLLRAICFLGLLLTPLAVAAKGQQCEFENWLHQFVLQTDAIVQGLPAHPGSAAIDSLNNVIDSHSPVQLRLAIRRTPYTSHEPTIIAYYNMQRGFVASLKSHSLADAVSFIQSPTYRDISADMLRILGYLDCQQDERDIPSEERSPGSGTPTRSSQDRDETERATAPMPTNPVSIVLPWKPVSAATFGLFLIYVGVYRFKNRKRPRAQRFDCTTDCVLETGTDWLVASLIDISLTGAKVQISEPYDGPRDLKIIIKDISTEAQVIWRTQTKMGLHFETELDQEDIDKIIEAGQKQSTTPLEPVDINFGQADDLTIEPDKT